MTNQIEPALEQVRPSRPAIYRDASGQLWMADGTPVFEVQRTSKGSGQVKFKCPHCKTTHCHGVPAKEHGDPGLRASHCWKEESPFERNYYLIFKDGER